VKVPPNFVRKHYLIAELLIFKYWRQNISVSNTALHTAVIRTEVILYWYNQFETVQLLTLTPDFIVPALWTAKSPDLNPVNYTICGKLQERVYRSRIVTLTRWSRTWSRLGTIPPGVHQWRGQAVASTSSSLHSSTWRTFWTQTKYVWYLQKRTLWQSHICLVAYSGHLCFWVTSLNRLSLWLTLTDFTDNWHFVCS